MKTNSAHTIQEDAEYAEVLRVHNELAAKKQSVDDAIQRESVWAAERDTAPNDDRLISDAVALKPGVAPEPTSQGSDQIRILQAQSFQLGQAISRHAEKVDLASRRAGYRMFAKDDAGYIANAEKALGLVDGLIAANQVLDADLQALFQRGCSDLPNVRFPTPDTADQLPALRREIARQIDVLKLIVQSNR
ncbi:hypothetical protein GCM10027431_32670 [Lysobacter rhizosphaerae]